jgi:hypothetical protein
MPSPGRVGAHRGADLSSLRVEPRRRPRPSRPPHPAVSFYLHATGTGSDGSEIRFTIRCHFVLDKRTGEDRCNPIISTCRVS